VVEHDRHRPSLAGFNDLCLSIWPNLREADRRSPRCPVQRKNL
jgi:hypothetical protein